MVDLETDEDRQTSVLRVTQRLDVCVEVGSSFDVENVHRRVGDWTVPGSLPVREDRLDDAGEAMGMLRDGDLVDALRRRLHAAAFEQLERRRCGARLVRPDMHMEVQHARTVPHDAAGR